ncbi:CRTAC1 family protein [Thalassococcus sp. BH17M4-6]|uniref:CRTAC1 family protein n=1 Tax=Thalassococcus sp. BH17M4-6 TaxID=3413148 RepID=UPI003BC1C45B
MRLAALLCLTGLPALADPMFVERSDALPVEHIYTGGWDHFVGGGVAIFDCNGDARPDLFAAGGTHPATLLVNRSAPGGDILFDAAKVPEITAATGAYPLDIDNDDVLDLFVLRLGPNLLLRGKGDCTFEDATAALGIETGAAWTTAFTATWEPGQTLPTLAIGNYVDQDHPDAPFGTCDTNWLLRPDGGRYGAPLPLDPGFCPLSMLFSDWRRGGEVMLRLSNDRQYYVRDGYEQMWTLAPLRELGPDDGWDRLQLWGMGIASRDLSGDGRPEVMLTSMGDQVLMTNTGSGFAPTPYEVGATAHRPFTGDDGRPSTGWHAEFGDVDNDGRADLFIAKGNVDQMPDMAMADPNNLLMQRADGTFEEKADVAGVASDHRGRGAGLADLNADGRLDLVVVNRRAPLQVWQNATRGTDNWLTVDPRQSGANRRAVGAFVEVRTAAGTQAQEVTVGGGHAGGQAGPLHFGLGGAETAEVRVIWPDGTAGDWQAVAVNNAHLMRRD